MNMRCQVDNQENIDFVKLLMGECGLSDKETAGLLSECLTLDDVQRIWNELGGSSAFPKRPKTAQQKYATAAMIFAKGHTPWPLDLFLGVDKMLGTDEVRRLHEVGVVLMRPTCTSAQEPYRDFVQDVVDRRRWRRTNPWGWLEPIFGRVAMGELPAPTSHQELVEMLMTGFADAIRQGVATLWPLEATEWIEDILNALDPSDGEVLRRFYGMSGVEKQSDKAVEIAMGNRLRFGAYKQRKEALESLKGNEVIFRLAGPMANLVVWPEVMKSPAWTPPAIPHGEELTALLLQPVSIDLFGDELATRLIEVGATHLWRVVRRGQAQWRNTALHHDGVAIKQHRLLMARLESLGLNCGMPLPAGNYPWNTSE